jgi:uracil-DNA glycosylase
MTGRESLDRLRAALLAQLSLFAEIGVTHLDLGAASAGPASPEAESPDAPSVGRRSGVVSSPVGLSRSEGTEDALEAIRHELGECTRCRLHEGRKNIVFGMGNPKADLMFVGEAPGADEDLQGLPFVGRAGQLLTRIIEAMKLTRDQVYIANILKCRPPENRNPLPDEVACCEPFLFKQVEAVRPVVVVALGKYAAQTLLRTREPITRLRGRYFEYRGALLMPTFHPSYLLRNPGAKREVWDDMQKVMETLQEKGSGYYS